MNQCKACKNKAKADGYCGKHTRLGIIEDAKTTGKQLCNPLRGCFSEVLEGRKRCDDCRVKERAKEATLHAKKQAAAETIVLKDEEKICTLCLSPFTKWNTEHGEAKRCLSCHKKHAGLDLMRSPRIRNYKEEAARNIRHTFEATKEGCVSGKRGRVIEWSLTFEEFETLVKAPCCYCRQNNETEIRGIDRIDNHRGYVVGNVASACGICNRMKHIFHPEFFIEHCKMIELGFTKEHRSKWPEYYKHIAHGFEYYKRMATDRRSLSWNLTKEAYDEMIASPCYICKYSEGPVGIDRVDPTIGYERSNCQPCCSPCNMMKHTLSLHTFREFTSKISMVDASPFSSIPRKAYMLGRSAIELVE
jgi:hypothetical protein